MRPGSVCSEFGHLVVDGCLEEPVRLHVGLNLRELLESLEEGDDGGELLDRLGGQEPMLVKQLIHGEVDKRERVSGKPGPVAKKTDELFNLLV